MSRPLAIVLSGHGLNCEREQAGAEAQIHHLNDLAQQAVALDSAQILAVPGGFSFGDHLGAGKAYASALNARLDDAISALVERGGLVIGICNGAQILLKTRLFAGVGVTLAHNAGGSLLTAHWPGSRPQAAMLCAMKAARPMVLRTISRALPFRTVACWP